MSNRQRFLAEWLLCVFLLLCLGAFLCYSEYQVYQQNDANERERLARQALVIKKNLEPQLYAANKVLQRLQAELGAGPTGGEGMLNERLRLIADTLSGISPLVVTDASGRITHSNVESLVGFDASVRDYFQNALKQRKKNQLYVSPPFISALGTSSISLVRELTGKDGEFKGVVLAALDPAYFDVLLGSVRFSQDASISVVHGDGRLFMTVPAVTAWIGKDLTAPECIFSQFQKSGLPTSVLEGMDCLSSKTKLSSFYSVQPAELAMDKALVVTVSRNMEAIRANWLREVKKIGWIYAGLCLVVCAGLYFYQWRRRIFRRRERHNQKAVRNSEAWLRSIFEATPDALLISDVKGHITMANRQVEHLLGYAADELLGQSIESLVPARLRKHHVELRHNFSNTPVIRRMGAGLPVKALRKDGSECDVEVNLSRIDTDEGVFFASALRDITQRLQADEEIRRLAFYDPLTGLPNRTLMLARLQESSIDCDRRGSWGSLLYIDLDHFKTLNSTLGYDMGDLLLQQVAERLRHSVAAGDTVARVGGDEFVVIQEGLGSGAEEVARQTQARAEKLLALLGQPYLLGEVSHSSTASIGVTNFQYHKGDVTDLIKQTDLAMHHAKQAGRNTLRFFDPAMATAVVQRVAMERDLRTALASDQFLLHYQVQVDGTGGVTGAEVLLRWHQPARGMVSPADFIPLAEETGVILPLGHWVLATACAQLERWSHVPAMEHLTLAVNVSALQFAQADFEERVMDIVQRTGANPQRLKLELTESLLVGDVTDIIEKMTHLKDKGIGFSLDDFGTGYSSLAYLSRLPLDQLKIDKSFVSDVLSNPDDAAIARTIIALAHSLDLGVIAEGVETEAQRQFLAASGCHACQGYLFGRPLPLDAFEAYVLHT